MVLTCYSSVGVSNVQASVTTNTYCPGNVDASALPSLRPHLSLSLALPGIVFTCSKSASFPPPLNNLISSPVAASSEPPTRCSTLLPTKEGWREGRSLPGRRENANTITDPYYMIITSLPQTHTPPKDKDGSLGWQPGQYQYRKIPKIRAGRKLIFIDQKT